jgi:hypothetical protein
MGGGRVLPAAVPLRACRGCLISSSRRLRPAASPSCPIAHPALLPRTCPAPLSFVPVQVSELGSQISGLSSERDQLEREADQMQRDMEEMARQLQVCGWDLLWGGMLLPARYTRNCYCGWGLATGGLLSAARHRTLPHDRQAALIRT